MKQAFSPCTDDIVLRCLKGCDEKYGRLSGPKSNSKCGWGWAGGSVVTRRHHLDHQGCSGVPNHAVLAYPVGLLCAT